MYLLRMYSAEVARLQIGSSDVSDVEADVSDVEDDISRRP